MELSYILTPVNPMTIIRDGTFWLKRFDISTVAAAVTECSFYDLGSKSTLGANLCTTGNFSAVTGWTAGDGSWVIGSGVATATNSSSTLSYNCSEAAGSIYRVTFTLSEVSGGSVVMSIGGVSGTSRTTAGTYTEYIRAAGTTDMVFTGTGFTGVLKNVTVYKVGDATNRKAVGKQPSTSADVKPYDYSSPIYFEYGCLGIVVGASSEVFIYTE